MLQQSFRSAGIRFKKPCEWSWKGVWGAQRWGGGGGCGGGRWVEGEWGEWVRAWLGGGGGRAASELAGECWGQIGK